MNMRRTIFDRLTDDLSSRWYSSADAGGTPASDGGSGGAPASASSDGGSDAGSSSGSPPPSSPAVTESTGAGAAPQSSEDIWASLGMDHESEPDVLAVPQEPVAPATPEPAPSAPPTPPVPAQAEPKPPAPAEPASPAPAPAAQPPVPPSPGDPVALAAQLADPANRAQLLDHLVKERFALSNEEVAELEADAVTAVPKLLARVHLETMTAVMRFMGQSVPMMMQKQMQTSEANRAARGQFFSKVPGLDPNNPKHEAAAARVVGLFRQMNPEATVDEIIATCGPMILQAVGNPAPPPAPPRAPPPAPKPNGAFRPAVGSGGASPGVADTNPFEGLGASYDD